MSQVENFSWLVPGVLAGLAHPGGPSYDADMDQAGLREALGFLREQGIGAIVSLTEYPLDSTTVEACGFEYLQRPVPDMEPPAIDDIETVVEFVDKASLRGIGTGVHCLAGLGRTGTMLACYLVSKGEDASAAVARVRRERPGSVETPAQEEVVLQYARHTSEALNKA